MKKLRKAFIISVMSITVLSTTMFAVPMQVGAAAQAGDLIKMDGLSSVYYLGADNKRYVFPNEATYFSWYSDFSGVVTIPQAELESYPLGKNVTVRPGTKLVKITTNPKVYAVTTNGMLLAIPDEATAKTLYGDMWAKRVVDVADSFFQNYTISTYTVSATAYPAGSLVKFGTDATVYYIAEDGTARAIASEAVMAANRFKMSDVITATIAAPMTGTPITGAESALTDTASGAGGVANAGTGVSVSLSGDTAASATIPSSSSLVPFISVNLTAAADGAVTVQNMTFTRTGTGATTDFLGGYLYAGDTRLSTLRSVSSSDNTISFNALNLAIPAGTTKTVTLKMNADASKTGNHAFKLASASSIITNGAVVSGTFPITGNTLSYSSVNAGTVTLTGANTDSTVKVGATNVVIGEFDLRNNSSTEDVNIYSIRLKQEGTAAYDAVKSISLDLDGTVKLSGLMMTADKYVEFKLDTPYLLKKSTTITATVRGDIVTDITKTVSLYLNNAADVDARGTAYGTNYSAGITNSFGTGTGNTVTIQGSDVDVSLDGPAASDIKDDSKDVILANFKIKSNTEDINIETLRVKLSQSVATAASTLTNVEMVDSANNASYTVTDPGTGDRYLDFENIYLTKGVQYNFQIRADVPDGAATGAIYSVSLGFGTLTASTASMTAKFQDADETAVTTTNTSASTLTGKNMTVAAPSIDFSKVTTSNATYVENTKGVLLYKGKITASSVSDLKVSKVKLTGTFGTINSLDDAFDKLYLYAASDDMGTALDTETSLTNATAVSFSGFNLNIPKGSSNGIYVVVRGDVKNNPTAGTLAMHWGDGTATTTNFTVKDVDNNALVADSYATSLTDGQTTTISGSGTFTMAWDSNMTGLNAAKNVLAGTEVLVGRIKLTAQNEDAKIEDFSLYNYTGDATADDVAYLNLYSDAAMTTKIGSASLNSSRVAEFADVNITVSKTAAKYVYVGAVVKGINYSTANMADATATAARTIALRIASSTYSTSYDVKALGVSTGDELSLTGVASTTDTNTATIMGAVISNITSAFANGLLANGTAKDVFSFKVTAPESSNLDYDMTGLGVKLATTTFTVATSAGVIFDTFKVERVGGQNGETAAKGVTSGTATAISGSTFVINFANTYGTNQDLIVKPGETAEFVIKATISGVDANDSAQTTLEGLASNVNYTHNTGTAGVDGADITAVYTLLPGVTYVRGGSLTN